MNLLQQNLDRYINDEAFLRLLGEHEICILSDFCSTKDGINSFWRTYYHLTDAAIQSWVAQGVVEQTLVIATAGIDE